MFERNEGRELRWRERVKEKYEEIDRGWQRKNERSERDSDIDIEKYERERETGRGREREREPEEKR